MVFIVCLVKWVEEIYLYNGKVLCYNRESE